MRRAYVIVVGCCLFDCVEWLFSAQNGDTSDVHSTFEEHIMSCVMACDSVEKVTVLYVVDADENGCHFMEVSVVSAVVDSYVVYTFIEHGG